MGIAQLPLQPPTPLTSTHALDDAAKRFYEMNGFEAIPEQPLTLFLSVATAIKAMQSEQ